jgi:hypothetical protein
MMYFFGFVRNYYFSTLNFVYSGRERTRIYARVGLDYTHLVGVMVVADEGVGTRTTSCR